MCRTPCRHNCSNAVQKNTWVNDEIMRCKKKGWYFNILRGNGNSILKGYIYNKIRGIIKNIFFERLKPMNRILNLNFSEVLNVEFPSLVTVFNLNFNFTVSFSSKEGIKRFFFRFNTLLIAFRKWKETKETKNILAYVRAWSKVLLILKVIKKAQKMY